MKKYQKNIAVVGAGYWGKNLIRNFYELGALNTICDANAELLHKYTEMYSDVKTELSFASILNNRKIKAVVIASPAEKHFSMVEEALLADKDVYVEKPLCLDYKEGQKLVELAENKNKILMVGHLLHYHPAVRMLKQLIADGKLGKIAYIYSNRLNLGKIRREENILWSFAPHDISVILSLACEEPDAVSCSASHHLHKRIADITVSNLSFSNGIKSHIFVSWLHPFKEQRLVVVGEEKMAVFDDTAKEEKLVVYEHSIEWKNNIPVPKKGNRNVIPLGDSGEIVSKEEPLKNECIHFLDSIANHTQPLTDGNEGIRVLKVLNACQDSLEHGGKCVSLKTYNKSSEKKPYFMHPTCAYDGGSHIGRGTKIWHFSHIMQDAKIGENCNLGQNVVISPKVSLGRNVKVQNNVSIYSGVTCEDDVFIGPSVVFTNIINPRSHISRKNEYKTTYIKKGASIGANSTIVCGITIGEYAFAGAGSVITKDALPFSLIYGNPATHKGWICACGFKLDMEEVIKCAICGKQYELSGDLLLL